MAFSPKNGGQNTRLNMKPWYLHERIIKVQKGGIRSMSKGRNYKEAGNGHILYLRLMRKDGSKEVREMTWERGEGRRVEKAQEGWKGAAPCLPGSQRTEPPIHCPRQY